MVGEYGPWCGKMKEFIYTIKIEKKKNIEGIGDTAHELRVNQKRAQRNLQRLLA